MQTAALDAYILSRKMRFAGAPVTLAKLLKMWQLPHDGGTTIDGAALDGVARYCKMTVAELTTAVEAMRPVARAAPEPKPVALPPPPPAPMPTSFATVTIPPAPVAPPAPEPPPVVIESMTRTPPDPTAVMPSAQLDELVVASRKSSPVIETPAPLAGPDDDDDDAEIDVSFDEVEATPIPELVSATAAPDAAKSASAKSGKSKKSRKKKS